MISSQILNAYFKDYANNIKEVFKNSFISAAQSLFEALLKGKK
jgi:hypothetical protein